MSESNDNFLEAWQPIIPSGNLRIYLSRTEPVFLVQYYGIDDLYRIIIKYPEGSNLPSITKITSGKETVRFTRPEHRTHGIPYFQLKIRDIPIEELPFRGEIDILWGGRCEDMDKVDQNDKTHGHINMWTDGQLSYRREPADNWQDRGNVLYNSPVRQQFLLSSGYDDCDSLDNLPIIQSTSQYTTA